VYLHTTDERPPSRLTTRLTIRIAVLTGLAIAVFSVVFFRLWYLEVLSGDKYRTLANDNHVREVRVQPPRGDILDRRGKTLVDNREVMILELRPSHLPKKGRKREAEFAGIEAVTGMSPAQLRKKLRAGPEFPGAPIVLRQGIGIRKVYYVRENRDHLPGVSVEHTFVRNYKDGTLAAHLFGNTGEVTAAQLKEPRYHGLQMGDIVGQSGIEYEYDRFLRGRPGATRIQVDALGRPKGRLASTPAHAGDNVRLTLDLGLQATGEAALHSFGLPGAFVAMDVHSGAVLAMGSAPTFDPAFYTKPHTQAQYKALEHAQDDPLFDRAIQAGYPTGSAFKPITATAALEDGLITPGTIVDDPGFLKVGGVTFRNAGGVVNGPLDMSNAIKVSSDVYFYKLGLAARAHKGHGQIQDWARRYGLGAPTGIDLPGETSGLVPTPAWRNRYYRDRKKLHCGLCPDRPWSAGDNINLAVGQGDLQVSPLQLAVAYAALANGGTVVRPHLGDEIESVTGRVLEEIQPPPRRHIRISDQTRNTILGGMERAAMEDGGTSFPVFGNFPIAIAGKTGTAQRGPGVPDQSWYGAIAPYKDPKIVVVATVERGGFGVDAAAPVVARILEHYFRLHQTPAAGGLSPIPGAGIHAE
jgi:penicillin-binding protein 2